ncbi:MAG: Crp/Fnr family transcriptional regulator [Firmicutes bacterium]|nr:Crp/Fnr family transcriptional regulator [Bacillota bacterium]
MKEPYLSSPGFEALFAGGFEMEIDPGGLVFFQAEEAGTVYLIREGRVRVSLGSPDGRSFTLAEMGPGEILGETALFAGGGRTANAVAVTKARLVGLKKENFLRAIAARPEAAFALIMTLAHRLREADRRIEELSFMGIKERLRSLYYRLKEEGRWDLLEGATHQEIAEMIGAARESVSRALAELRQEGIWCR